MDTIRDTDLILYHYRDGLADDEIARIAAALAQSPDLRRRYEAIYATLHAADTLPGFEPDAGFDRRLWNVLDARIDAAERVAARPAEPKRSWRDWLFAPGPRLALGGAFALALALGVGYQLGRDSAPESPRVATQDDAMRSSRVLDAYVAAHLRATEGAVLTAVNSDSADLLAGNRELAANLIDSNRLYAAAAVRAGNTRLADFLRQLEPLLLELANPPAGGSIQSTDGLRDYLDKTDLLFQLRATQKRIDSGARRPTSA
ncbi:MAG TPA: hypothetical protein VM555_12450 [Tahibacter sp.]|nr:hypothetical protein [Tahibacter sp.]